VRALSVLWWVAAACGPDSIEPRDTDVAEDTAPLGDTPGGAATPPQCGDGVVDAGEACDDGNGWYGDGCTPTCGGEDGPFESEPNDVAYEATPASSTTYGHLIARDVDCFGVTLPAGALLGATVRDASSACATPLILEAFDPTGVKFAEAISGSDPETGCATLDPTSDASLLYLSAGWHAVCVRAQGGIEVPGYALTLDVGDDACAIGLPPDPEDDHDGDGVADACDDDDDGDTVADPDDNCPLLPNGPGGAGLQTQNDGWLQAWSILGPFVGAATANQCLPSATPFAAPDGLDDGLADPRPGDSASGAAWRIAIEPDALLDFRTWLTASNPREAYAVTWVRSPIARAATLFWGADDGVRVWVDGEMVADIASCQPVNLDQFRADVNLTTGWTRLLFKVRDNSGNWALRARFKDAGGAPIRDLDISPGGPSTWIDDQTDGDGDGIGDACDPTP
jgi:cysteine-rich repeat protein